LQLDTGDGPFFLSIPTVAGAIVIKAQVAAIAQQGSDKHQRDLARLLAIVVDPVALRSELSARERGYVAQHHELRDVEHPAWRRIAGAEDGASALSVLIGLD
jgi:hypothetical protein